MQVMFGNAVVARRNEMFHFPFQRAALAWGTFDRGQSGRYACSNHRSSTCVLHTDKSSFATSQLERQSFNAGPNRSSIWKRQNLCGSLYLSLLNDFKMELRHRMFLM